MEYRIKSIIGSACATLMLTAAGASAQGYNQLAANAGLSQSEAAGMSRAQIAAVFFNHNVSPGEEQPVPGTNIGRISSRGTASFGRMIGLTPEEGGRYTFEQMGIIHSNRGQSASEQQAVDHPLSIYGLDHGRLIAAAGLKPAEAVGLTLNEIAAHFHNRNRSSDDLVPVSK